MTNAAVTYLAGDSIPASITFSFPPDQHLDGSIIRWSFVDNNGTVYANGDALDVIQQISSFAYQVKATAVVPISSSLPPTTQDLSYQIRWELCSSSLDRTLFSFETIRVGGLTSHPEGPENSVEMENDQVSVGITISRLFDSVGFEIYQGNNRILPYTGISTPPVRTSSGYYYSISLDPFNLPNASANTLTASLDPYLIAWKYWNSVSPGVVTRETTQVFILNGSLTGVLEDVRMQVMKARTTLFGTADTLFDNPTIIAWLRRGRDLFNAGGGYPTSFTMTNATGGIREYWIRYSEVSMLRAQALAEGEKAFNFSGQAISLDVDKSQYYQTLADNLQQQLDNDIKPFKANLLKKGLSGGDGDASMVSNSASARVGIMITPASQFGRIGGYMR